MPGLSRLFAPREREFFDLFEEAGRNIVQAGDLLERTLDRWPDHGELAREIVICEQEGDRITHDIIQRLTPALVTPIEREDLLDLPSPPDAPAVRRPALLAAVGPLDASVVYIEEAHDDPGLFRIGVLSGMAQEMNTAT